MHLDLVASESDTAEEIAFAIPQLRTVALGTQFWSVDRASPGTTFRAWSKKQVAFRSEDTVGPMGEWLLRYHAL